MRIASALFCACLLAAPCVTAWANGGGGMSMPSTPITPRETTPQEKARAAYNDGVHYVKKADKAQQSANESSDPGKKDKASKEAHDAYAAALAKFTDSVGFDSSLHEAWN